MTLKIVFLAVVALALLTLEASAATKRGECSTPQQDDRDWIHHHYSVFELSTTDVATPSPLFFGSAPLQNGTSITPPAYVWGNILYNLDGTKVVGFDVGLCTLTPAINNTGSLYQLCNIVHYFNNGTDQVVLNGAVNYLLNEVEPLPLAVVGGVGAFRGASGSCTILGFATNFNAVYVCDFWTPKYRS